MPTLKGKLIVVSAPSGAGKTTIAQAILRKYTTTQFSVSATTRSKRENETHGKDYFFITKEEFERKIQQGDFVEWEIIYGNYYGTLKSEVERITSSGYNMVFDVDVKGALSIKKQYPDAVLIFIQPPSIETLRERLRNRRTENPEVIERRMQRAAMEMEQAQFFDYVVVNDNLQKAIEAVNEIVWSAIAVSNAR
jgi:guanylate kinase